MRLAQPTGAWTTGYVETYAGVAANSSAELGHEVDVELAWSPWVPVDLRAGYSLLVLGDGLKALVAQDVTLATGGLPSLSQYAYLQATLRVP